MKDLHEDLTVIQKEFSVIKRAPLSFAFACIVIVAVIWTVFYFTYRNRIDSKDATIQSKESERDRYKAEAEQSEKENDRLRQNLPINRDASLALKTEVLNLAKQLEAEAAKWKPGDRMHQYNEAQNRFQIWLYDVIKLLDRHGQWSESLRTLAGDFHSWGKDEMQRAAKELRAMAAELKD